MTPSTPEWAASEQQGFLSRVGGWFKRSQREADAALDSDLVTLEGDDSTEVEDLLAGRLREADSDDSMTGTVTGTDLVAGPIESRSTFLRPWARRDAAIENLQNGLTALSDLMGSVRENLDRQSNRQDEVLGYLSNLSHLPQALTTIHENNRAQGEALRAIGNQIERQTVQQTKLGDVLERINKADGEQRRALDALQDRVETLNQHDEAISQNLYTAGSALETVSRNSEASTRVMEQLRDNMDSRDVELERILHRQGTRFTTMLSVAIFLSVSALVAVGVMGYLGYEVLSKMK